MWQYSSALCWFPFLYTVWIWFLRNQCLVPSAGSVSGPLKWSCVAIINCQATAMAYEISEIKSNVQFSIKDCYCKQIKSLSLALPVYIFRRNNQNSSLIHSTGSHEKTECYTATFIRRVHIPTFELLICHQLMSSNILILG